MRASGYPNPGHADGEPPVTLKVINRGKILFDAKHPFGIAKKPSPDILL
jgi:hypothetical protein